MRKEPIFGIVGFILVGVFAAGALAMPALKGLGDDDAVQEALEAGDYGAWKQAMTDQLTEDKFSQMQEMYAHMEERRSEIDENTAEIQSAIETEDYDAWLAAIEGTPKERLSEYITEENFSTFVELQNARQKHNFNTAIELGNELGLPIRGMQSMHHMQGHNPQKPSFGFH